MLVYGEHEGVPAFGEVDGCFVFEGVEGAGYVESEDEIVVVPDFDAVVASGF